MLSLLAKYFCLSGASCCLYYLHVIYLVLVFVKHNFVLPGANFQIFNFIFVRSTLYSDIKKNKIDLMACNTTEINKPLTPLSPKMVVRISIFV